MGDRLTEISSVTKVKRDGFPEGKRTAAHHVQMREELTEVKKSDQNQKVKTD